MQEKKRRRDPVRVARLLCNTPAVYSAAVIDQHMIIARRDGIFMEVYYEY